MTDSLSRTTVSHGAAAGTPRTGRTSDILRRSGGRSRDSLPVLTQIFRSIAEPQYSGMLMLSRRSIFIATRKNQLSGVGMLVPEKTGS
jgi:hypothetical protein